MYIRYKFIIRREALKLNQYGMKNHIQKNQTPFVVMSHDADLAHPIGPKNMTQLSSCSESAR